MQTPMAALPFLPLLVLLLPLLIAATNVTHQCLCNEYWPCLREEPQDFTACVIGCEVGGSSISLLKEILDELEEVEQEAKGCLRAFLSPLQKVYECARKKATVG